MSRVLGLLMLTALAIVLGNARAVAAACPDHNPYRNVYFGDLHVHTSFSHDAYTFGVRQGPRAAYRFARGEAVDLSPYGVFGIPPRTVRLAPGRELDFAAVTDHAEFMAPTRACTIPTALAYFTKECRDFRRSILPLRKPQLTKVCETYPTACDNAAVGAWAATVQAANEFDEPCRFTAFAGYEWTGTRPDGSAEIPAIHRNVLFRTGQVPERAVSALDVVTPEGLWDALIGECVERSDIDCDALAIPHSPAQSNGWMFRPEDSQGNPLTASLAALRAEMEPVVEMSQIKGTAECSAALSPSDESCAFELFQDPETPLAFVRGGLKEGLRQEARIGVNPFRFGLIGSTDTHNATPGMVGESGDGFDPGHIDEGGYEGWIGWWDSVPQLRVLEYFIEYSAGSLAGIWATENTRDALFAALKRREVFATSGPRLKVRLFAGYDYPADLCGRPTEDALATAYDGGVPMGGVLGTPGSETAKPRFLVQALADPGIAGAPGAPLAQIEIIKGWYDGAALHERVVSVAEKAPGGRETDAATCEPGDGAATLCAVWTDEAFEPDQNAFYYARVLEVPTCRWSAFQCRALGVDCNRPETITDGTRSCCDGTVPQTIQERAWSSPIWYSAGAIP
ncbi:MAG: DUF3604 domain-containing protein [Rhodospirillales bacterium]